MKLSDNARRLLKLMTADDGLHMFDPPHKLGPALRLSPDELFAARDELLAEGLLHVTGRHSDAPPFDAAVKAYRLGFRGPGRS